MLSRRPPRILVRILVLLLITAGLYGLVRLNRDELVDFAVPYRAAGRFLAHEPLYRPDDGHYQYKYLPAFAAVMVPFTLVPKRSRGSGLVRADGVMAWGFVRLSIAALPDRRLSARVLFWLMLLLNGKFLVKELAFGQFNLPVALLLLGAVIAAQHGRGLVAGAAIAAGVFVKPYALVLLPWLAWTVGWRSLVVFGLVAGGRAAAARRIVRLERQPDPAARVVSHGHRHDGTEPARGREHLVRLDVGEVARARPHRVSPCARLNGHRCRGGRRRDGAAETGG